MCFCNRMRQNKIVCLITFEDLQSLRHQIMITINMEYYMLYYQFSYTSSKHTHTFDSLQPWYGKIKHFYTVLIVLFFRKKVQICCNFIELTTCSLLLRFYLLSIYVLIFHWFFHPSGTLLFFENFDYFWDSNVFNEMICF